MSFFSRALLIAALALAALLPAWRAAQAIQLSALYLSACRREVGVVLHVDPDQVQMLGLDGAVRTIARFDVIYLAFYPVSEPPMTQVEGNDKVELVTVSTIFADQPRELARGWMVNFSEEQISFLTTEGNETVVDTGDIWDIRQEPQPRTLTFPDKAPHAYHFTHPYPFAHCGYPESALAGGAPPLVVYPQTQLDDPLLIKTELDRLQEGFERTAAYQDSKGYYPVPQLYQTETLLGVALTLNSRYGASSTRNNNFIPVLTSGLTEGPFGFQRIWVAGAAPMSFSYHEEPQTQLYYRLKADYLHFSFMFDLGQVIIGSLNYNWHPEDLSSRDDRLNEFFHVGGGFDYGAYAVDLAFSNVNYAIRFGDEFFEDDVVIGRFGFFYHRREFKAELYFGRAADQRPTLGELVEGTTEEDVEEAQERLEQIPEFNSDLRFLRFNLELTPFLGNPIRYSVIRRQLKFRRKENIVGEGAFEYASIVVTNALYHDIAMSDDLTLSFFISLEARVNRYGFTGLRTRDETTFLKGGAGLTLRL